MSLFLYILIFLKLYKKVQKIPAALLRRRDDGIYAFNYFSALATNTASSARVQLSSGLKVVSEVPLVTPFSTAQDTDIA